MNSLDWVVVVLYIAVVFAAGLFFRKHGKSSTDFFLAGRSMGWFPIGLSVMVTIFSAINYLALPGEVYGHGLYVVMSLPVFFLVAIPVTRVWMPFFHRMQLTSAYEYLELRFDNRVRKLAGWIFLVWKLFWMATALFASGRIIGTLTGLPVVPVILAGGLIAVFYTFLGGIRAVMWTDVLQFFVLFGGIVLGLMHASGTGGIGEVLEIAGEGGRLRPYAPFDPEFLLIDPAIRMTLWSCLIGVSVAFLARYGADQVVMQRYFTARTLKQAQKGLWLNAWVSFFCLSLLALFGLAVYASAVKSGNPDLPANGAIAAMILSFPAGITGLVAAGLMAATMSSVDSGMNACSAAWVTDLKPRNNDNILNRGRTLTLALGTVSILMAIVLVPLTREAGSLFMMVNKGVNAIGSPLLALFILGMFTKRTNSAGALWGGITGFAASLAISFLVKPLALHYYAFLNLLATIVPCLLISTLVSGGKTNSAAGTKWTWLETRRNL
ncbi:hypothetical protein CSA37_00535 [Candidatus Fermentibacteria bacterium]|nr:MAG: hypothetical protein CSA37_09765 [Candidatus Fermentibacteria bacterium]PIE53686.1 MAG: hypothetical protein CSA37_00535 [Candidatus Fermentibacteria bacterium]